MKELIEAGARALASPWDEGVLQYVRHFDGARASSAPRER